MKIPNKNFLIFPEIPHSEMVYIKGGTFEMGSNDKEAYDDEQPVHKVAVPDFYIGKYLVTQKLWKHIMGKLPIELKLKGLNRPVEGVSWNDIVKKTKEGEPSFLEQLNALKKKEWGEYRLPTEAEWEYAARGGTESKSCKYPGSNFLNEVAWYEKNSHFEIKPVGLKAANELGLYDMSGNVYEWCSDRWHGNYINATIDGSVWLDDKDSVGFNYRIVRGGSWYTYAQYCRPSYRYYYHPDSHADFIGFRLVFSSIN